MGGSAERGLRARAKGPTEELCDLGLGLNAHIWEREDVNIIAKKRQGKNYLNLSICFS